MMKENHPITFLEPESREEAQVVAKKIWISAMSLIRDDNGFARFLQDRSTNYSSVMMTSSPGTFFKSFPIKNVDLVIIRAKPLQEVGRKTYYEGINYFLRPDLVLIKEIHSTGQIIEGDFQQEQVMSEIREADKAELSELLGVLENIARRKLFQI